MDRFNEIKAQLERLPDTSDMVYVKRDDAQWLVSEVERLQGLLKTKTSPNAMEASHEAFRQAVHNDMEAMEAEMVALRNKRSRMP